MVPGHTTAVSAVAFCAEGGGIVTAADGTLRFWNLAAAARERTVWRHGENVYGFAFSPDGARAASSAWGGEIKLWDAATGREIRSWTAHKTSGVGLAWSGDGRHLISGGNDGGVRAWDPASGKQAREFEDIDNGRANHIALSPDGRMFLAPSSTGTAKVWELESGRLVHTLAGHKSEVYDVAWSSDARLLATAGTDGVAKLWDARTGTEFATLKGHSGAVYGIAFHPDGKALATASQNRTIRLWDAASGREVAVLRGHDELVYSVRFNAAGDRMVSASTDKTVKLWDTRTGALLLSIPYEEAVWSAEFSPDGSRIVALPGDGTIRILDSVPALRRPLPQVAKSAEQRRVAPATSERVSAASTRAHATLPKADLKPAKTSLAEFACLEGKWRGTLSNTTFHAEQQWWPAKAGLMTGMFRLTDGEKLLVVEFFTLRETPAGIELRLRHFDAALNPMEKGDPIILQLASAKEGEALFENPVHSRPKNSRITRTGPDSYVGRSEIIGEGGAVSVIEARWTREPPKTNECPDL